MLWALPVERIPHLPHEERDHEEEHDGRELEQAPGGVPRAQDRVPEPGDDTIQDRERQQHERSQEKDPVEETRQLVRTHGLTILSWRKSPASIAGVSGGGSRARRGASC